MKMNKKEIEELKLKYEEIKLQNQSMSRKLTILNSGKQPYTKDLLGLTPGKLYLIITDGRRIVGKLVFENKSFICYTKRDGERYYTNKSFTKLIKEMSEKDQVSYGYTNFNEIIEGEE